MNDSKQWSIHAEFLIIFITLLGGYYMITQQIDAQACRIDQANARTDQLYTMFIDLLKEGRK